MVNTNNQVPIGDDLIDYTSSPPWAVDLPDFDENGSGGSTAGVGRFFDQRIDGLLAGIKWAGSISYSDPDSRLDYQAGHPELFTNFHQISADQLRVVHAALDTTIYTQPATGIGFSVEGFSNLTVNYAGSGSGAGTIRLVNTSNPSTAYAYYPSNGVAGGDAFFGPSGDFPTTGNYDHHTIIHEVGHALGLKHGHESSVFGALPYDMDSMEYSVMTYRSYVGQNISGYSNETWGYAQTYMMFDIAALQHMYGADFTTNSGNTTYTWSSTTGQAFVNGALALSPGGNRIFETIWDGGGVDAYDLSNYSNNLNIDLTPGGHSTLSSAQRAFLGGGPNGGYARGNVFNALLYQDDTRSLIENAYGGSGNDVITGNVAANALNGLAGNDTLNGLGGNDTLGGGDGNDVLDGGTGADRMLGGTGSGNDTFYVDSAGDQVVEYTNQGTDTVLSSISHTLASNVENLTLSGTTGLTGTGNALANVITGNVAANALNGLAGNDTLNGLGGNDTLGGGDGNDILDGGSGADRMLGGTGTGNDTFYVDNLGDQVVEYTNQGSDAVFSSITYTLAANVENLTLTGTAALSGTGNTLANVITGNGGKNVLSGLAGADTLAGGANADVLIGGTGPDRFDFNLVSESTATARDAIRAGGGAIAFEGAGVAGGDLIDLSGIDANTGLAGNQAFVFGGTTDGHLSLVNSGTTTILNANVDADAAFEFVLAIEDGGVLASAYKAVDFIL